MISTDEGASSQSVALTLWHQAWPLAALAMAVIVNLAWIGFLGYGLAKLL
jgi:hypothetical protein